VSPANLPVAWRYNRADLETIDVGADLFDEQLVAVVEKSAQAGRQRAGLVGYTWTPSDWSRARVAAFRRSGESASKQHYVGFLKERYAYSIERVNELYGIESTSFTDLLTDNFAELDSSRPAVVADDGDFLAELAGRLAESVALALRTAHPGALLFTEPLNSEAIAAAMAPHADVLVSQQPLSTAKAQVLLGDPPAVLAPNVVGLRGQIEPLARHLPTPPK
jgi:hypothetical protein